MIYDFKTIDQKWQERWAKDQAFRADPKAKGADGKLRPKYYALDMFPYPSGAGLHIGHMASYTPTDVVSRYKRARGFNVLHPMGYDAFGLPAEQYAIQTGVHPAVTTNKAIENFRRQLRSFGFSFDWDREISTCEPSYYKWTQWIFTILHKRGLAYQKEVPVNWCPALKTVLANEEVIDGKSERGGHPVVRMPMRQWMLKITDYAERLLADLDKVDWPERTKEAQRNWIGKSEGARVFFGLKDTTEKLEIFTTRPDTLFGVTFMVLAPEHPLVKSVTSEAQRRSVEDYVRRTASRLEIDRKAALEKTGVFTGGFAKHPFNGSEIPIWIADYVMMDYGTGAIMAVPGHDERDFEFAAKFSLPIRRVLASETPLPFVGDGHLIDSEFLSGLAKGPAIERAISELEARGLGQRQIQYKLRDWLFSRQRYWGEPFPIVHFESTNGRQTEALSLDELPVALPEVADYEPTEKGEPPLARVPEFVRYSGRLATGRAVGAASSGESARRETDTMPGSAGSSWYFLRYCDPHNDAALVDFEAQKYWMPVDLYVGGPEHSVGHLLYARFWQKVLFDAGLVSHDEPFQKLAHQGIILAPDGQRMSKSRGNVVNPDELRERYGADALRAFILFLGPLERDKPWQENGIDGVARFLERLWRWVVSDTGQLHLDGSGISGEVETLLHKTIKKVTEDFESLSFNTAISAMMIYLNELYRTGCRSASAVRPLIQLLAPIAPHLCEELWERTAPLATPLAPDQSGLVSLAAWPTFDPEKAIDRTITLGVQVNGKSRGTIDIAPDASEEDAVQAAMKIETVRNALGGQNASKVIYKAGRILNLIAAKG